MSSKPDSCSITTTLSPLAHGVLGALAAREDPSGASANGVLTRLLREELERLRPGLWDALVHGAAGPALAPKERSAAVRERVQETLAGAVR
jgi:hypothetical protein